jgi:hypothetical protein
VNAGTYPHRGDAGQVATVIAFLASPLSVSINGKSIACGGGTPGAIGY